MADLLDKLFGGKKKSIKDITLDELRREKVRLDQEEAKTARKIDELEKQKQALFARGKDEPAVRQQRILARKIKELDAQAKSLDQNLQFFSRQLRIINGFTQLKENQRLLAESGLSSLISNIDLQTLQIYVDKASVDGVFHMEKFSDILGTLEEGDRIAGGVEADRDVEDIVRAMQEAKSAGELEPAVAVERGLERMEQILDREKPEADF